MKGLTSTVLALALTIAGAACTTPMAPDRARVAAGITARTGANAHGLPVPTREWTAPPDTSLADGLTVDEAVAIALWNNAEFQTTLATLGIARADLIEAGLLRNPVLSLLFPWGPKQLEFVATFAVDQLWQRPKRVEDARLNAEANAEQLVATGLRLVADVRLTFFDVLAANRRLTLAIEQAEVAGQASRLIEGQLRVGDISEFEARLARADALRLDTTRLTRIAARDLAKARLNLLLGLDPMAPDFSLTEPGAMSGDGCTVAADQIRTALAARPEVRAAELQIEAAGARVGLEQARIVALTASLDANGRGLEGFEMGPGLTVELPVLAQNQGQRARAAAELEQASRRYLAVRASVSSETAAAVIGLTEAREVAQLLGGEAAASVVTARRQAERLFAAGEISLPALLVTRQRLIDMEAARLETTFGVSRAIVRLEQAVGKTCGER